MKIAYLVFAYKNPLLLARTIGKLSSEDCAFFVHIDKHCDITQFSRIRGDNIVFSGPRVRVYWAEFSGIQAILLLIQQALAHPLCYEYFVLLSGSEYPLRSSAYIHKFLERNQGLEFISMARMPAPGKPLSRINTIRFQSNRPLQRLLFKGLAKVGLARRDYRKHLLGLMPYSGMTWWTLTRNACRYILDFVAKNHSVTEYFENVFAPEETFFHTILGNSSFKPRVRRNLLYEDWSVSGAHPALIGEKHVAWFEARETVWIEDIYGRSEALFARKLSDASLSLTERIDRMIEQKENSLLLDELETN